MHPRDRTGRQITLLNENEVCLVFLCRDAESKVERETETDQKPGKPSYRLDNEATNISEK